MKTQAGALGWILALMLLGVAVSAIAEEEEELTTINQITPIEIKADAGDEVKIKFSWNAQPTFDKYRVFVNFIADNGKLYYTKPHYPPVPTTEWEGKVEYEQAVILPDNIPSGTYKVVSGLAIFTGQWEMLDLKAGKNVVDLEDGNYQVGKIKIEVGAEDYGQVDTEVEEKPEKKIEEKVEEKTEDTTEAILN